MVPLGRRANAAPRFLLTLSVSRPISPDRRSPQSPVFHGILLSSKSLSPQNLGVLGISAFPAFRPFRF
jgi:hypothetical protein